MHPTDLPSQNISQRHRPRESNLFSPRSIAVIGASKNPAKIGSQMLHNIISGGYEGEIFPINLKGGTIQGLKAYTSVREVPQAIDHAVIAIPAKGVLPVLEECGEKRVPAVTVISAGFKESGPKGATLERQLVEIANHFSIKVIGPNCLGFINTDINLNATFSATTAKKGHIVLFSQSGAFGTAILDWAAQVNLGFKYFISLGNKAVIDESALLEQWITELGESSENIVYAGYLEDIVDGRRFMKLSSEITQNHPLLILKPGKTFESQRAISSHTGALATEDKIIETALQQAGCVRVHGIQRLFDAIQMLARQSIPRGDRVAIVTNAGGPGVVTTDLIEESTLDVSELSETTQYTLSHNLPDEASTTNPVDVLGDATAERFRIAIETVLLDENVDSVIVLLTPQAVTEVEKTASVIAEIYQKYPFKPVVATFIGGEIIKTGVDLLNHSQMPIFTFPRQAVSALECAHLYRKIQSQPRFVPEKTDLESKTPLTSTSGNIVGRSAEELIVSYGFSVPESVYLKPRQTPDPAVAEHLHFPLVAKLISPKLIHKTEFSGVITDISNQSELETAVDQLNSVWMKFSPQSNEYSIHVQKQIPDGEQIIMGFKQDPSFGPVITFGAGGTLAELLEDVSHRIAPVTSEIALNMIEETKMHSLLKGFRRTHRRDINSIVDSLVKVSHLALEHPEIKEFDINPYIVLNEGSGGYAADVKIVLHTAQDGQTETKDDK